MNPWQGIPVSPHLLGDLYESVLSPERVPGVLRQLNVHLDCDGIHLVGWNESTGTPLVSLMTSPDLAAGEAAYLNHFAAIDPRRDLGARRPTGVGGACHDFFDRAFVDRSPFYQDFLLPLGPRYIYGGNLLRQDHKQVHLVFNHWRGRPEFEGAKRQALDAWMPHLARWTHQLVRAEGLRQAAAMGEWAIDALDHGLVFFDGQGRLLHANRAAVLLLGDRLRRPNLGQTGASASASSLEALVRQVAQSRQAMRFRMSGVLRPMLSVGLLPIMRTSGAAARLGLGGLASASDTQGLPMGAEVVLTLETVEPERPTLEQMAGRWRLTPAERRLLRALVAGHTVREHALAEGVKESTVRTHVRSVLEKTRAKHLRHLLAMTQGIATDSP